MAGFIAVAASLKPTKGLCWVFSAVFLIFLDANRDRQQQQESESFTHSRCIYIYTIARPRFSCS